jgi:hypothetical protein
MKRLAIISCLVIAALAMQAQRVNFYSQEFARGVRLHLDLPESYQVPQSRMDTITSIDLSGLGIKDIRDVVYLPSVRELNLSYNELTDVSPLLALDSLRYLDLSYNRLENINVLAMSCADSMEVDVMNNYIKDFSYFFTPTLCEFNFVGMYLQLDKSALYMDACHLYCDVNEKGSPVVAYRGYSNAAEAAVIGCNGKHVGAVLDGAGHTVNVPGWPQGPAMVTLSVGELGDTTWVLPPVTRRIAAGAVVPIETGLPEGYRIGMANALHGTVTVSGTDLSYTAPGDLDSDTLYVSYYEGWQLRGFTEYRMLNAANIMAGDVDGDGSVNINDITTLINYLLNGDAEGLALANADCYPDGRVSIDDVVSLISYLLNGRWE